MKIATGVAVVVLLAGCSVAPPSSPHAESSTGPTTATTPPPGCKQALPAEGIPWSAQTTDGIDGWWIGTVNGEPAEMRIFDAMMKADLGETVVGLWICSAR